MLKQEELWSPGTLVTLWTQPHINVFAWTHIHTETNPHPCTDAYTHPSPSSGTDFCLSKHLQVQLDGPKQWFPASPRHLAMFGDILDWHHLEEREQLVSIRSGRGTTSHTQGSPSQQPQPQMTKVVRGGSLGQGYTPLFLFIVHNVMVTVSTPVALTFYPEKG